MTLKRAVVLATMLVAAGPSWGQSKDPRPTPASGARSPVAAAAVRPQAPAAPAGVTPRHIFTKPQAAEIAMPNGATGRLIIKFRDDIKARVADARSVVSLSNVNLDAVQEVINAKALQVKPTIRLAPEKVAGIESRAAALSGRAQPDLGGMMYFELPAGATPQAIVEAARALNNLPEVEFVDWELSYLTDGGGGIQTGACCIPTGMDPQTGNPPLTIVCAVITAAQCGIAGGVYQGDGIACPADPTMDPPCVGIGACCVNQGDCQTVDEATCDLLAPNDPNAFKGVGTNCIHDDQLCDEINCGHPLAGSCFECHDVTDPEQGRFCDDEICCDAVCGIDPFCCDEDVIAPERGIPHWDSLCVSMAQQLCGTPLTVCESPFAGSCFEEHPTGGCSRPPCCEAVCNIEPFCCDVSWDALCVETALQSPECFANPTANTPTLAAAQGYLTDLSYIQQWGEIPGLIAPGISEDPCLPGAPLPGFGGQGWDLDGLWSFGAILQSLGTPGPNLTRGRTIKVGIIEHTAFADWQDPARTHEDLRGKVIPEPGQTLIINPNSPAPELRGDHGTACLGIVGAKDDGVKGHSLNALGPNGGEVGCVGIAPEADLYFFPIISVEEGGRLINAIASALEVFGPGDVLSFSIGPEGGETLASNAANWTMLRLAADLGVTCCIAAGNDCTNVDGLAQFQAQDSDVIIVGACFPGFGRGIPFPLPGWDFPGASAIRYCRLGFSNFCRACAGSDRVWVSAWGTGVATLGYGDMLFAGGSVRSYTNSFGGTSAACPQIAALVANLQGLSKQFYGIPLTPVQIRSMVVAGTLFYQCGIDPPDDIPGPDAENPCLGDFDPDAEPARIGGSPTRIAYPNAVLAAEAVVGSEIFGDNPNLSEITIIRGQHVFGNQFSIMQLDNNFFVLRSLFTNQFHQPNLPDPARRVQYIASAQTADVMVTAHSNLVGTNSMELATAVQAPGPFAFMITEMFDWVQRKWTFITFQTFPEGATGLFGAITPIPAPARFINTENRKIAIRLYTFAPGGEEPPGSSSPNGGGAQFTLRIDLVRLRIGSGFGGPDIGLPPSP